MTKNQSSVPPLLFETRTFVFLLYYHALFPAEKIAGLRYQALHLAEIVASFCFV